MIQQNCSQETNQNKILKKISYSQLSNWKKCPHYHWLLSIEKLLSFEDNVYNLYGSSVHDTIELMLLEESMDKGKSDYFSIFKQNYINLVKKTIEEGVEIDADVFTKQASAFKNMCNNILPFLKKNFGKYRLVSTELELNEDLNIETDEYRFAFTGFVDCIIQTEDGKYHILDWKTCSKTWNEYKRADTTYTNQLLLYKNFFQLNNPDIKAEDISTHYVFLPTDTNEIELFTLEHGKEEIEKALNDLDIMIKNAFEIKQYPKKVTCQYCECKKYYNKTK